MDIFDYQQLIDDKYESDNRDKGLAILQISDKLDELVPDTMSYKIMYLSTKRFEMSDGFGGFSIYLYNNDDIEKSTQYTSICLKYLKVSSFDRLILNNIQKLKDSYCNGRT